MLGKLEGYSLGSVVDSIIEEGDFPCNGPLEAVRMLAPERFDYSIVLLR